MWLADAVVIPICSYYPCLEEENIKLVRRVLWSECSSLRLRLFRPYQDERWQLGAWCLYRARKMNETWIKQRHGGHIAQMTVYSRLFQFSEHCYGADHDFVSSISSCFGETLFMLSSSPDDSKASQTFVVYIHPEDIWGCIVGFLPAPYNMDFLDWRRAGRLTSTNACIEVHKIISGDLIILGTGHRVRHFFRNSSGLPQALPKVRFERPTIST